MTSWSPGPAKAAQAALVDRLRGALGDEPTLREVRMFGGLSFLVRDRLLVSALPGGDLLVRVAPEAHATLVGRRGAAQAEMGAGRDMGPGWIEVAAAALTTDADLSCWLDVALRDNRAATGGQP